MGGPRSYRAVLLFWAILALLRRHVTAQPPSSGRIAYGSKTKPSSYPSYVALSDWGGGFICGGTLIAPNIVLTARHCLGTVQRATIGALKLGGYDNEYVKGGTSAVIKKKIGHPNYSPATYRNDIAILVLSKPLDGYKVAQLAAASPRSGSKLTVVGHGETGQQELPSSLLRASMTVRSGSYCDGTSPGEICLEASKTLSGYNEICSGDSGGPAYASPGVIVGVASYGLDRPCGRNPWSVFTDVPYYANWIKSTIARYGGGSGTDGTAGPLDDGNKNETDSYYDDDDDDDDDTYDEQYGDMYDTYDSNGNYGDDHYYGNYGSADQY